MGLIGNRAVARLLGGASQPSQARARGEDDESGIEPDWEAPIETEADQREEGSTQAVASGPADGSIADDEAENQTSSRSEEGGSTGIGTRVQRQAAASPPIVYPAFSNMRWNETISNAAWNAWAQTLRAATKTSRREQGFWIQWDTTSLSNANGSYRAVGHGTGPSVGPAQGATINLGTKPADSGNWHTVGSFHTHTPTRFRSVGRVVGPSGADGNADTNDNVAGLVYDYEAAAGGAVPAGHPTWSSAKVWHSGPARRT